jgi:hypothetical protein
MCEARPQVHNAQPVRESQHGKQDLETQHPQVMDASCSSCLKCLWVQRKALYEGGDGRGNVMCEWHAA